MIRRLSIRVLLRGQNQSLWYPRTFSQPISKIVLEEELTGTYGLQRRAQPLASPRCRTSHRVLHPHHSLTTHCRTISEPPISGWSSICTSQDSNARLLFSRKPARYFAHGAFGGSGGTCGCKSWGKERRSADRSTRKDEKRLWICMGEGEEAMRIEMS